MLSLGYFLCTVVATRPVILPFLAGIRCRVHGAIDVPTVQMPDCMAQEVIELFKDLGIAQQNSVLDLLKRVYAIAG